MYQCTGFREESVECIVYYITSIKKILFTKRCQHNIYSTGSNIFNTLKEGQETGGLSSNKARQVESGTVREREGIAYSG